MPKILCMFLLLGYCCFCLTGCGFKDIDKRFFVIAMGFDWTANPKAPYLISLRLAIPTDKIGEGLAESQVETVEALSIAEAVRIIKSRIDKELDFGQCKVFLFGNRLVQHSMNEPLNWLARRRDMQMVAYLAKAEPDAIRLIKAIPKTERLAGNSFLLTFGKEGTVSPYTVTELLFDGFRRFKETGLDPFLPIVSFDGDSYVVEHLSLLDKTKERLVLNPQETKLYNLSANEFSRAGIATNFKGKRLAFYVTHISRHVSITDETVPVVNIQLQIKGMVEQSPAVLLNNDGLISEAQRSLQQEIENKTEKLLYKIRNADVDPYGFGLHYLAQYFGDEKAWKHWQDVYPIIKFNVTANINIESTGLIK